MADVGLRDADGAVTKEVVEFGQINQALAGGDGNAGFGGDFAKPERIAGRQHLLDEHGPRGRDRIDIGERCAGGGGPSVEVDHDLDVRPDRLAQRAHHARGAIDLRQKGAVVSVRDDHDFHRAIASRENVMRALDQLLRRLGFIDRAHVAEAEMRIDPHPVAHPAPEQHPHRDGERLAQNIPKRDFDSRDRAHADDAEAPEAVLLHDAHELLDVARIAADHEGSEILDRACDRARFPLERRLAPSEQAVLIGLDAHEDPVPHLRVYDDRANIGDLQQKFLPRRDSDRLRAPASARPYPYRRAWCSAMITAAIRSTPFATI